MTGHDLTVYASAQVGALYVWGAQGQQMTAALIRRLEDQTEKDYKRALAAFNDHVANGLSVVAYDCSGLVVKFLLDAGLISRDRSANGLYHNECDSIGKDELVAGDLVFKKYLTKDQMYHVGVYMGDGSVVHAKGRDVGVVREPLSAAGWNRFGRLKCWGGAQSAAGYSRLLKNSGKPYLKGDDVRGVQHRLENKGYDTGGTDGVYGPKTEKAVIAFQQTKGLTVDGIVGLKTWAALIDDDTSTDQQTVAGCSRLLKNSGKPYFKGDDVEAVQEALKSAGLDPGKIDGIYGSKTEKAVVAFQTSRGLTIDGIVGKQTATALGLIWAR